MNLSFDNINIKDSLKYRLMFIFGALVHASFIVIFTMYRIDVLAIVNIFSVLLYVLGSIFSVNKRSHKMRYGWMIAFFTEIILHTVLCILLVGSDADFYLYLIGLVPVSTYVLFFSCKIETFLKTMTVFILVALGAGGGSAMAVRNIDSLPLSPLSYTEIETLRMLNMICATVMLVSFSLLFVIEVHTLVRDLSATNNQLEYTATHDALTGLLNRHSVRPMVQELIDNKENFCVILGDIDDFKKVNDTYGHDGGDLVLKKVSAIISDGASDGDIVCRWGGEEILVILRGERQLCLEKINSVHCCIRETVMKHDDRDISVTMTFGFADSTESNDMEELVSISDKRLYRGKKNGKNVVISVE